MNNNETMQILNLIKFNYPNFEIKEGMPEMWFDVLMEYSFEDVKMKLEEHLSEDRFQKQPPTAYLLVKGLPKIRDRIDFTKDTFYCDICNRPFNNQEELKIHRDKCSSIRYLIKQNKKWFNRNIDKKFLWNLSDEEFDERYNKMLKYIMEHTTDENERTRIGYIFNKPSEEEALKFLKGN